MRMVVSRVDISLVITSNTLKISYDLDGDRYFIGINVTDYDDKTLKRKGAEKNTEKLIETFQNGVESFLVASAFGQR